MGTHAQGVLAADEKVKKGKHVRRTSLRERMALLNATAGNAPPSKDGALVL